MSTQSALRDLRKLNIHWVHWALLQQAHCLSKNTVGQGETERGEALLGRLMGRQQLFSNSVIGRVCPLD